MKERKRPSRLFKIVKYLLMCIYPETKVFGAENIKGDEPVIIIGNHTQMHGPICCEFFLPDNFHTWCAWQMMVLREVPAYAYADFWSQKPRYTRWFYKILAYLIAPISVLVFNNARTIPVYRDNRIVTTFRQSVRKLEGGENVVIFPEYDKKYNHILYDFRDGFVDVARLYHKRTGKEISFVPLYIAPSLKGMYLGTPVKFSADTPIEEERRRICDYLMGEITRIAEELPLHTVVPYRNTPKKLYPKNKGEVER